MNIVRKVFEPISSQYPPASNSNHILFYILKELYIYIRFITHSSVRGIIHVFTEKKSTV